MPLNVCYISLSPLRRKDEEHYNNFVSEFVLTQRGMAQELEACISRVGVLLVQLYFHLTQQTPKERTLELSMVQVFFLIDILESKTLVF